MISDVSSILISDLLDIISPSLLIIDTVFSFTLLESSRFELLWWYSIGACFFVTAQLDKAAAIIIYSDI